MTDIILYSISFRYKAIKWLVLFFILFLLDIKLLDDWYCKDYNSVPVVYRLRHITDRYPNHNVK